MTYLVLDNGAYNIKSSYSFSSEIIKTPNCIYRSRDKSIYIGSNFAKCRDTASLLVRRPFERGHLTSWSMETGIWDTIPGFTKIAQDKSLVLTEMPLSLRNLSAQTDEIVFEEYEFNSLAKYPSAFYSAWNGPQCQLIIDCGFSSTNILPVYNNMVMLDAVRRIDIGGKLLTNWMKETISLRHYNVMDETFLVNEIKESVCFVAKDYKQEFSCQKPCQYLLPDYIDTFEGRLLDPSEPTDSHDQILSLSSERFQVPELLFNPHDIGLRQAGLPEAVWQTLQADTLPVLSLMTSNIKLVGGCSKFPGFKERLVNELRPFIPSELDLNITLAESPVEDACKGGVEFARQCELNNSQFEKYFVTRKEYLEGGENYCTAKFYEPMITDTS
ncbi:hypothetical protein CANCADRAFT_51969 [Tortispora caseinolytica NRRL Y-17796]|uniref:Actin-like protein ARP6 n=1 Tax=Tortispora caseinolytica NRRL Y-17796 TaxID=767744 RepID=A0A1E4THI9_9ASCO|nr:hypothetical protein CANCADRAFT_51969 [Tortispora caseinolytica NRRL Y-17796]